MQRPAHLIARFSAQPQVLDGGMATELESRGVDISGPLWSARALLEAPDAIEQLHRDYLQAGADVIITATYQLTFAGMAAAGYTAEQTEQALLRGVRLAVEARKHAPSRSPLCAASIGPYGAFTADRAEYHGNYAIGFAELLDFHRRRFDVLADSDADLIAFETTPSLEEARVYATLLQSRPDVPAWISFSCRDEQHVSHGEPIAECARELDALPNVVAIGVNCTPPRYITPLIKQIRGASTKPIVVYPNGTQPEEFHCPTGPSQADEIAMRAPEWIAEGANLIGGCCHTGPQHIAALRRATGSPASKFGAVDQ